MPGQRPQRAPLVAERDRVQSSLSNDPSPSTREPAGSTEPTSEPSSGAGQTPEDQVSPTPADPGTSPEDAATPADPAEPQEVPAETQDAPDGTTTSPGATSTTG